MNIMGKFDNKSYAVSAGTNGVGLTSVNAVSSWLRLETTRDGGTYAFECEEGKVTKSLFKCKETRKGTGTVVKFQLDGTILKDVPMVEGKKPVPKFDIVRIRDAIKTASYLNPGLLITLKLPKGNIEKYQSQEGIRELIRNQRKELKKLLPDPLYIEGKHNDVEVIIAFNWDNSDTELTQAYANGLLTPQGGTHLTGFRIALGKAITNVIASEKLLEGKNKGLEITGEDCREGMISAVSVRLSEAKFHSQTKDCLGNREAQSACQKLTSEFLNHLFGSDPKIARLIANRAIAAARGRIAAKRAKEVARKTSLNESNLTLPSKLADCISNKAEDCELFLVEG